MSAYPEGFWDWPKEKRHAFFKAEADAYEAKERQATKSESRDKAAKATAGNGAAHDDDFSGPDKIDLEIVRLAKLPAVEYERIRKDVARKLDIRVPFLDRLVAEERPDRPMPGNGRPLELATPEPWPESVNGAALVSELTSIIRKYVVLTENDGLPVALWVLHSYCFDSFPCTPRLAIMAPEKRCGKTTLLDVIALLVSKALGTANISPAALFRTVELARPILLIDEADTFLGESEELRGILNAGHRAGGQVIRTVGDDFEPRAFSTHCPVAIAQIGKLPGTLADRSIHISMKRRAPGEPVTRFRFGRTPELVERARKAVRWVADNADAIRECDPAIPDAIYNRAADNWAPLLAVAEVAGNAVAAQVRHVALASCGVEEELSFRVMLLADIRDVFKKKGCGRLTSADLVAVLVAMADRPWGECSHGKALTQNQLARKLKPFSIRPEKIGPESKRVSGYSAECFDDAFNRYISPARTGHPDTYNNINDLDEKQTGQLKNVCPVENSSNQLKLNDMYGCPVQNPESGVSEQNSKNVRAGRCAQCNGVPDGKEKPFDDGHGGIVLLHPECRRFWGQPQKMSEADVTEAGRQSND